MFHPVYRRLLAELGPSGWWPAKSPFEVMVGAVLVQNTSWTNVELALSELRQRRLLNPRSMAAVPRDELALIVRSSGYYNQKARKLHEFLAWYGRYGYSPVRVRRHFRDNLSELRQELQGIHGIGPETADSILCYALELPYFVVDKYTMRWLERYRPARAMHEYEPLRAAVEREFRRKYPGENLVPHYNEFHALLVRLGNGFCRKTNPACGQCPLRRTCALGRENAAKVRAGTESKKPR